MINNRILLSTFLMLSSAFALNAQNQVTAKETKETIPTYLVGNPDLYPYFSTEELTREPQVTYIHMLCMTISQMRESTGTTSTSPSRTNTQKSVYFRKSEAGFSRLKTNRQATISSTASMSSSRHSSE